MQVRAVADKEVTTIEGLSARWASQRGLPAADAATTLHPVQQAWIDQQVPMCGFCQYGMMIKATELLEATPDPTVDQIKTAFMSGASPHLCRCGTYSAIVEAVQHAATLIARPATLSARGK
jgi:isoquinoline 1-oxidoreductase alpha subunit